jgi:hypothetical protein
MEIQLSIASVLTGVLSIVVPAMGWFIRTVWNKMEATQKELTDLKVELPSRYVHNDNFKMFRDEIMNTLDRIDRKLDSKVNREDLPKD